jgi:uroporphyrin-3 C-methyltransferase
VKPTKAIKPKAWFAGTIAFVALLVALAGLYVGNQQLMIVQDAISKQQTQVTGIAAQLDSATKEMKRLASNLQEVAANNSAAVSQINGLTDIVANNQRRIDEVAGTERSDWQLAEAEYLLRLANQRLVMSGEVRGSKALLQAADGVLVELDDVALISVRQAIAADIAALNRADSLDVEGLYLRVAALSSNVEYLSLRSAKRWQSDEQLAAPEATSDSLWQTGLQKAWATLSQLVVVRQSEQRVLPQMSDVEVIQLQQGLHYLVEQAKFAVITGKQPLYNAAIANLQRWILDYYDAEEHNTAAMLSELQLLSDARVSQVWPDIGGSLHALQMVIKDRLGLASRESAQGLPQETQQ